MPPNKNQSILSLTADIKPQLSGNDFMAQWDSKSKRMGTKFSSTIEEALKSGLKGKNLMGLATAADKFGRDMEAQFAKLQGIEEKLAKENVEQDTKFKLLQQKKLTLAQLKITNKQWKAQVKQTKEQTTAAQKWKEVMVGGAAAASATMAEGVADAFNDLKGGNLGSVLKKFGSAAKLGGGVTQAKAGEGAMGVMQKALGGMISGLGTTLMIVGAVAAGFAAIVKIALDADAQAKEINRSLLDADQSVGDITNSMGDFTKSMTVVRKSFTDFDFNHTWGTTSKDLTAITNAFGKVGYTIKEIEGTSGDAKKKLQDTMAVVLTYSKLIGMSGEELATSMGDQMNDLGLTLQGVQERFSLIYDGAVQSGFGVKRFFAMVLQATSGMSMYNVRLEEAGALLKMLGKSLGQKQGGEFLQSLTKGFGEENYQDRYKRVLHAGKENTQGIYKTGARNAAQDLSTKLLDKNAKGTEEIVAALGKGIDITKADSIVDGLSQLTDEQRADMEAKASAGGNSDLVRVLHTVTDLAKASKGDMESMVKGLGSMGMGDKLAMMMGQTKGVGPMNTPMYKMSVKQLMAMEQFRGVSGQQLEELRRVSFTTEGTYKDLKKKASAKDGEGNFVRLSDEDKLKMAENTGAIVEDGVVKAASIVTDAQGNKTVKSGATINSANDYLQNQGGSLVTKALENGLDAQTKLAMEVATNTTDISKILEQGIEAVMEDIYDILVKMWAWLSSDEKTKEAKVALATETAMAAKKARRDFSSGQHWISVLKALRQTKTTDKDRADIDRQIKEAEDRQKGLSSTASVSEAQSKAVGRVDSGESKTWTGQVRDFFGLGHGMTKDDISKTTKQDPRYEEDLKRIYLNQGHTEEDLKNLMGGSQGRKGTPKGQQTALNVAALETALKSVETWNKEELDRQKKEDDRRQKEQQDFDLTKGAQAVGKWVADGFEKSSIMAALGDAGITDPEQMQSITAALQGSGPLPPGMAQVLSAPGAGGKSVVDSLGIHGGAGGALSKIKGAIGGKTSQDVMVRMDGSGRVVDAFQTSADDTFIGTKPGGAAAQVAGRVGRGGGGGAPVVVHNHFYQDARGNYKAVKQLLEGLE